MQTSLTYNMTAADVKKIRKGKTNKAIKKLTQIIKNGAVK